MYVSLTYWACLRSNRSNTSYDSFLCLPWLVSMSSMTHLYRHTSFIWVSFIPHVFNYSFIPLTEEIRIKIFGSRDLTISSSNFNLTGTPFTRLETCMQMWGLPWKRVWYVRGLPSKLDGNFDSRSYVKSNLLRLWCLPWLVWMCPMTHLYRHGSFISPMTYLCLQWLIYDSFECLQWLIYIDMDRLYECLPCLVYRSLFIDIYVSWTFWACLRYNGSNKSYDSFLCLPWLVSIYATNHLHVRHNTFLRVPRLIPVWAMIHFCVCHGSFLCVPWLNHMGAVVQTTGVPEVHQLRLLGVGCCHGCRVWRSDVHRRLAVAVGVAVPVAVVRFVAVDLRARMRNVRVRGAPSPPVDA